MLPCAARTQAAGARPAFLTGVCTISDSLPDMSSVVAEPEARPSLLSMDSLPVPPTWASRADHDAKVVAAFVVDADGSVRPGTVGVMSSPDSALSRWACDMVPLMRFKAARHHGQAVAAQVLMPLAVRPLSDSARAMVGSRAYLEIEVEKQVSLDRPVFPRYPADLKKEGIQGTVQAQFVVDTTGHAEMSTFHVIRASDMRFIEPVRRAIAASTFHPAELRGRKVRQMVQQPFTFALGPD